MIDANGLRANVGMILCNDQGHLFLGRRVGQKSWQFPQGGIKEQESPLEAMYRELEEEVGLSPEQVRVMGKTRGWLRYYLPKRFIRKNVQPVCLGQKQIWFLLHLLCDENGLNLQQTDHPEFDHWRWAEYWDPIKEVIYFKRQVYSQALKELAPLMESHAPVPPRPHRGRYLRLNHSRRNSG